MTHWAETKESHTATKLNTLPGPGDGALRFHSVFQTEAESENSALLLLLGMLFTQQRICAD